MAGSTETGDLMLEILKQIQHRVTLIADDVSDIKVRLTSVEEGMAGVHRRLDRTDQRIDRIEKRLDPVAAN